MGRNKSRRRKTDAKFPISHGVPKAEVRSEQIVVSQAKGDLLANYIAR